MSHLTCTNNKGFSITFSNDFRLSVQFGPGNYCEHYQEPFPVEDITGYWRSLDAEIAVISPTGDMLQFQNEETVLGYVSVETLVKVIAYVAALTEQPDVIPFQSQE